MTQFTIKFCCRISLFTVFFFTLFHSLSSLTLGGGAALCPNFGPLSELGVNEGVVSLLLAWLISAFFRLSNFSLFFIGSCFILFQS